MPQFMYKAMCYSGKQVKGVVLADNATQAKYLLMQKGLVPFHINHKKVGNVTFKEKHLIEFTAELAQLLKASIPLYQALSLLEESYRKSKYHAIILDLLDSLKRGEAFSKALSQHSLSFSPMYIGMVKSGESSATLADSLQDIVNLLEGQNRFKKSCISAFAYPLILLSIAFFIFIAFLFVFIPSFFDILEGKQLNGLTKAVLAVSKYATSHSFACCNVFILGVIFIILATKLKWLKKAVFQITIPCVSKFFMRNALVRFSRCCAVLLHQGIPLVEVLQMVAPVINHPVLEAVIAKVALDVSEGFNLSDALKKHPAVPSLLIKMVSIGEKSGNLERIFNHICTLYEADANKTLVFMQTFLQPIVLVVIGIIISIMLFAIMIPLTDVSSLI